MMSPAMPDTFKAIPHALCDRIRGHVDALESAPDAHAATAALFLAHCELKDAEAMIPKAESAVPAQS